LLGDELDPYPEGYLARLAQAGVNGVWLQAVLYKLAPFPWEPERSAQCRTRLKNLRKLAARAGNHGIRVFLYLNEPRAMPLRFFADRPNLKGVVEGDHAALCTSAPEVREFLVESVATICRAVPGLGGFFSISASENLSNCWSHGQGAQCPR
jgi:alpha-glucuronidase